MNAPAYILEGERVLPGTPAGGLAPSLEQRRLRIHLFQIVADVVLLVGCFYAICLTYFGRPPVPAEMMSAQLLVPIYLTIALHNGTYSIEALTNWKTAAAKMAGAVLIAAMLLTVLTYFAKISAHFSRVVFVSGTASTMLALAGARCVAVRWIRVHWGASPKNVLVIDAGGAPISIPHAYHVDAREHGLEPRLDNPHVLDRLSHYLRNMDEVIVNCPPEERLNWAMVLKGSGVHGEVASRTARAIGAIGVMHRDHFSTLLVSTGPLGLRARITKRLFDMAVSGLALILFGPLLLTVAALIKLEDGGPVFFRQRRLGQGNRFFSIYKLRTMRVEEADAEGHRSASRDDDRITRIGRFLRRSSIDELAQLINVLKGDMSLVGPRPHALGSQAGNKLFWQVDHRYWQRHSLRPGITGLAQIRGFRGATATETDLASRLQADLEYLAGWTIWRDIQIIAATARVMVHERAY